MGDVILEVEFYVKSSRFRRQGNLHAAEAAERLRYLRCTQVDYFSLLIESIQ